MALYIRQLDILDLDRALTVETAAFPPNEAASREKIEYRLTVCPELCVGLFLRAGKELPSQAPQDLPIVNQQDTSSDDVLIGHIIATRTENKLIKDEDMPCPIGWKADPTVDYDVGHKKNGKTVALHSLAVSPEYQRAGFGKALVKAYVELLKQSGIADRISILTYDRLVPYYTKLGFEHFGKSESEYAGIAWHDLAYPL